MLEESKVAIDPVPPNTRQGVTPQRMEPLPNATLESAYKKQELELIKYQFENKILANKLERVKIGGSETRDPNSKLTITTVHDVDLNYNTKTNYVTILEHKVAELTEQLLRDRKEANTERLRDLEMQLFDERKNYKDLKEKYRRLKIKYSEIRKNKGMFDQTLSTARNMRVVLKAFNDTGMINKAALKTLDLDFFDRVLDGRRDPYAKPGEGSGGLEGPQGPSGANDGDFRQILAKKDKTISDLRTQLKEANRKFELTSLRLNDQVAKEELTLNQRVLELKEGFKKSAKDQAERLGHELEETRAQLLAMEAEREEWDKKAQEATSVFEQQLQELRDKLFQKELEVKESADSGELMKQKFKQLEEKLKRAVRENQSHISKLMNSQIKVSTISREAINRSVLNLTKKEGGAQPADDRVSVDLAVQELKKIEEDLNKYDELGTNFEALKEVNIELTGRLQEQEREIEALAQQVEAAEAEKRAWHTKAELVQHEQETLRAKVEGLTKQVEEAHHRHDEDLKVVMSLKEQVMHLQGDLSAARNALVERESELAGLKADLEAKAGEVHATRTQLEGMRGELTTVGRQLAEVKGSSEQREAQLTELRFENERISTRLIDLEGLQDKFAQKELENSKLVDELSKKELNLKATISELHGLRAELVTLQKVIKEKQEKFRGKIKDGLRRGADGEGEGVEQVKIMHNLVQMKEEELTGMRELLTAAQTEAQHLEQKNAQWQQRFNAQVAEQQTYVRQIRELSKIKAVFDDLRSGQGDYVSLKMQHIDLQEELAQLKEFVAASSAEADLERAGIAADKAALAKLGARVEELEGQLNEGLARQILAEEKALVLADKLDDFMRANEHLEAEVGLRGRELEEVHRQLETLRVLAAEHSPPDEGEEPVAIRLLRADRDRLAAALLATETAALELRSQLKEFEIRLRSALEENAALQQKVTDATNWTQITLEKDLQIIEMARFGNEKSEALEATNHRLAEVTAQLATTREQLALIEERINTTASARNLLARMHDTGLTVVRQKYEVTEHEWNSPVELAKIYGQLEMATEELDFLRSGAGERSEQNPMVKRLKGELEALRGQLEAGETQMSRLKDKLQEGEAEIARLRGEKRDAEERGESRYKEIERLMGQIGELTIARTQLDRANQELRTEVKRLEDASHAQNADAKQTADRQSQFKLEINALVIDKKVLADRVAGLQEQLRERDRELSKARDEYFDVQENFISATEEFLQKIDDEKERGQRLELRVVELQTQLDERAHAADQQERRAQKLQEEAVKLNSKISTLNDTIALLRRTSRIGEENAVSVERIVELERQLAVIESQKNELLGAQAGLQASVAGLQATVAELTRRLEQADETTQDLQRQLEIKKTENADYEELILEMRTGMMASARGGAPDTEKLVLAERVRESERLVAQYQKKIEELEKKESTPPVQPEEPRERGESSIRESKNPSKQEEMMRIVKKRLEQIKELEQKLAKTDVETKRLEAELATLRDQNKALTDQIVSQQQAAEELGRVIERLRAENAGLAPAREKLTRKKAKISTLKAALHDHEASLGLLREAEQRRAFASEQLAQRELKYKELERRYDALEEAMQKESFASNKTQLLLGQKSEEIARLRAESEQMEKLALEHRLQASEVAHLRQAAGEKEGALAEERRVRAELEARIADLKGQLETQAARIVRYEELLKAVEHNGLKAAEHTEKEIELLRQSLNEAIGVSRTVAQRVERERFESSQLKEENDRLKKDSLKSADSLTAQLFQARAELRAMEQARATSANRIEQLESEVILLTEQLSQTKETAQLQEDERQQTIQTLQAELATRAEEVAELESRLRAAYESTQRHTGAEQLHQEASENLAHRIAEIERQNSQQTAELESQAQKLTEELREVQEIYLKDAEVKKALINDLNGHVQKWKRKCDTAEQELQRVIAERESLENDRRVLKERFESAREAQRLAEARADEIEASEAAIRARQDQLTDDNAALEARAGQLATKLALCQRELDHQRQENEIQGAELLALVSNVADLESYIERASRSMATGGDQSKALRAEVQRLEEQLEQRNRQVEELEAGLRRLTQLGALQSNTLTEEAINQSQTLSTLTGHVTQLEARVERLAQQRDQLSERARELANEVERLKEERRELVQKFNSQRSSLSDLQSQNSEFQNTLIKIDREKLDFQRQRAEIAELKDANEALRQRADRAEKADRTLQKYKEAHEVMAAENGNLMTEVEELSGTTRRLRAEKEELQGEVEELAAAKGRLEEAKGRLEGALQQVQKQNRLLEGIVEDQRADLTHLQADVEDFRQRLEKRQKH